MKIILLNMIIPFVQFVEVIKRYNNKNKQNINGNTQQNSKNSDINTKNGEKIFQGIMDKIPGIMKIRYHSFCKLIQNFEIFLGIRIFRQTIRTVSNKNHEEPINNEKI